MYDASIKRSEKFWSQKADEFINWFKPWDKLTESDFNEGQAKWFIGGRLNACYNCVDRHLTLKAVHTAIIWEGDNKENDKKISYNDLYKEVCKLANGLKSLGIKKIEASYIFPELLPAAFIRKILNSNKVSFPKLPKALNNILFLFSLFIQKIRFLFPFGLSIFYVGYYDSE